MSIYTFNNKVLKYNNKILVGGEPTGSMTSYSDMLKLSVYYNYGGYKYSAYMIAGTWTATGNAP